LLTLIAPLSAYFVLPIEIGDRFEKHILHLAITESLNIGIWYPILGILSAKNP